MSTILLATYNFYPYNWGGSEVYVDGLAHFLQKQGYLVKIIAAVPDAAFEQHGVYWSGQHLRICTYTYAGLSIYGAQHALSTTEIYRKYHPTWEEDWVAFFAFIRQENAWHPERFHLHGFTSVIGLAMLKAFTQSFAGAPIHASYHTPISCPKGTLLRWGQQECKIRANAKDCTACTWQAKTHSAPWVASFISNLLPTQTSSRLPTALQWKMLIGSAIQAFRELSMLVNHWWVFSDQIRQILIAQGVDPHSIAIGRHAAAPVFQRTAVQMRATDVCIFAFVGRFTAIKGFGTLLQAWQQLPIQANRKLWLIGDNNDADPDINTLLEQLTQRPDIQFLGKKSPAELALLYAQIHALIVPSEWVEIGPIVVHEALACGANVIGSAIGGIRELSTYYPPGAVQLFPSGDVQALATLLSNYHYKAQSCTVATEVEHYQKVQNWYFGQA